MRAVTFAVVVLVGAVSAVSAVDPAQRTADMPDSWLVLFNWSNPESVDWVIWYRDQWDIPWDNLIGLATSTAEHVPDLETVQAEIIQPVRDRLAYGDPPFSERIMGIVLGYGVPGRYGTPLVNPGTGGFSIADALQDMTDDDDPPGSFEWQGGQRGINWDCPYMPSVTDVVLPAGGRLTRATMAVDRYMVARIDAPTLQQAKDLTLRAEAFTNANRFLGYETIYYDYFDPQFPSTGNEWNWLRRAVDNPSLIDEPWGEFDIDGIDQPDATPGSAFRFSVYQLWGWSAQQFDPDAPGSRVLAFHLNSYGAVTVRSTTDYGGCYVPNVLEAGYAAAIGATAEPICCQSPAPAILLAALREGWTLGESYYVSNPYNDWMWVLVGDPFLALPNWFDVNPGDVNQDGMVTLQDHAGLRACLSGPGGTSDSVCNPLDMDGDGDFDLADFAGFQQVYTGGALEPRTADSDGDGDVDLTDFDTLLGCRGDPGPTALGSTCTMLDFNYDLSIDLRDYCKFQESYTGEPPGGVGVE